MNIRGILIVASAALLAACGSEPPAPAAAPPVAAPAAAAPADPLARLARAVSEEKTGAGVDLRYEILAKPAVGTPFDIDLTLVPDVDADSMEVVIAGVGGLTVTNAGMAPLAAVRAGEPHTHRITALAAQAGIYYVSVNVTTRVAEMAQARTFSVPVLLGGEPATQPATAAPPTDATGQAVEPMPAEERP